MLCRHLRQTLACASETFSVGVSSETSKIVFSALGSDELPIDLLQPEQDWTALDMRHVVDPATGSTINFKVQSEEPVSAGHFIGQPDFGDKVFPSFQNVLRSQPSHSPWLRAMTDGRLRAAGHWLQGP